MTDLELCHYCKGPIVAVTGRGRWHTYRGVPCEIPEHLAISTCQDCGREWLDDADVDALSTAFERQRLAATNPAVVAHLHALTRVTKSLHDLQVLSAAVNSATALMTSVSPFGARARRMTLVDAESAAPRRTAVA
jgi:hypothetical protein